jgi:hypothetical protein
MEINAVLVLRVLVFQVVCEPADAGEFVACRQIEICVTEASINGTVTDANIGEAVRIIRPDGNIAS